MDAMVREYNQWLKEHQNFLLHLRGHDARLYTRLSPIYEVLNFLSEENENNGMDFNDDLYKIFQIGFEFLHSQVDTCKLYLENTFRNDFHAFMDYDPVITYILYLDDLRYEMIENKIKYSKTQLDELVDYLEKLMNDKEIIPDTLNLYIDSQVHKLVDMSKWNFHSIIDIFVEIAETLGIELYVESEYIVGKDI